MRAIKLKNNAHWASGPSAVLCLHCNKQKKLGAGFPSGSKDLIEPFGLVRMFGVIHAQVDKKYAHKCPFNHASYLATLTGRVSFFQWSARCPMIRSHGLFYLLFSISRHISRRSLRVFSLCNSTLLNEPLTVPKKKFAAYPSGAYYGAWCPCALAHVDPPFS